MKVKRFSVIALLLIAIITICSGCGDKTSEKSEPSDTPAALPTFSGIKVSAGSGTAGGGQYVYVGGITNIINTNLNGVEIILEATKGSGENLALLQSGDLGIASIESSIAYNGMMGVDLAEGEEAFSKIRCLFASLPTHFIIATLDSKATNVNEFAGKVVAFGPYTGSTDISSRAVFNALGIIDTFQITNAGWGDCWTAMGDGQVYAVTGSSIHPSSAITELDSSKDINFIEFTDEQKAIIFEKFPYYKAVTLASGTYESMKKDFASIGAWQAMYASAEMDDDLAYMLTKTVFEHIDVLQTTHSGGYTTRLENISEQPVPLHLGAYRYYKEMGVEVPAELLPPELSK